MSNKLFTIEEYYLKRKALQVKEAKELAIEYKKVYGNYPNEHFLHEFFFLFYDDFKELPETFKNIVMESDKGFKAIEDNIKSFSNYDEFLNNI